MDVSSRSVANSRWLRRKPERAPAPLRLFCFPHAGAGASIYHGFFQSMPASIDVCAIEPPGHFSRLDEPVPSSVPEYVAALLDAIRDDLDKPFAVVGYSLGTLIGFEFCRAVRRELKREPLCMIMAAGGAPHLPFRFGATSHLPPDQFLRVVEERYEPIDPALRADPEMLQMILGMLRGDFRLLETYAHQPGEPFDCSLLAIAGTADSTLQSERVEAWKEQTRGHFRMAYVPGGHFFLRTEGAVFASLVRDAIGQLSLL
jgi:medium-chain acyl-[acyl-carrier-protein] hydrolase